MQIRYVCAYLSLKLTSRSTTSKFIVQSFDFLGPALVVSIVSLLANVFLIGGSRQLSKDFLLVWIAWKSFAILIFWAWFGYNQLKHHNYIQGIQNCQFCSLNPESTYIGKLKTIQFTPARTHFISELKSRVLKLTFLT